MFNVKNGLKSNHIFNGHSFQVGVQQEGRGKRPDMADMMPVFVVADFHIKAIQLVQHPAAIVFFYLPDINAFPVNKVYFGMRVKEPEFI